MKAPRHPVHKYIELIQINLRFTEIENVSLCIRLNDKYHYWDRILFTLLIISIALQIYSFKSEF